MLTGFILNHYILSLASNFISYAKKAVVSVASFLLSNDHIWCVLFD